MNEDVILQFMDMPPFLGPNDFGSIILWQLYCQMQWETLPMQISFVGVCKFESREE